MPNHHPTSTSALRITTALRAPYASATGTANLAPGTRPANLDPGTRPTNLDPTPNHKTRPTWKPLKRLATLPVAALAAVGLAACGGTPSLVSSPAGDNLPPAVDTTRLEQVIAQTNQEAQGADAARNSAQLGPRFIGPALVMRNGEYMQVTHETNASLGTLPLVNPQALLVGQAGAFPHYAMSVSGPQGGQSLHVFAFVQSQARANYALWGWVKLFPKVKFPSTYKPEVASPNIQPNSGDYVMKPGAVAQNYLDVLVDPNHKSKDLFDLSLDSFNGTFQSRKAQYAQLTQDNVGLQFSLNPSVAEDGIVALGTADKDALVMTTLNYSMTMTSDKKLEISALAQAYTGKSTAGSTLVENHKVTLLFRVPSKGSGQKVQLLGAADAIVGMSAN